MSYGYATCLLYVRYMFRQFSYLSYCLVRKYCITSTSAHHVTLCPNYVPQYLHYCVLLYVFLFVAFGPFQHMYICTHMNAHINLFTLSTADSRFLFLKNMSVLVLLTCVLLNFITTICYKFK